MENQNKQSFMGKLGRLSRKGAGEVSKYTKKANAFIKEDASVDSISFGYKFFRASAIIAVVLIVAPFSLKNIFVYLLVRSGRIMIALIPIFLMLYFRFQLSNRKRLGQFPDKETEYIDKEEPPTRNGNLGELYENNSSSDILAPEYDKRNTVPLRVIDSNSSEPKGKLIDRTKQSNSF